MRGGVLWGGEVRAVVLWVGWRFGGGGGSGGWCFVGGGGSVLWVGWCFMVGGCENEV